MERKQFLCRTLQLGLGSCGLLALEKGASGMAGAADSRPDELTMARNEATFVRNWAAGTGPAISLPTSP